LTPKILNVDIGNWIRGLFSSSGTENEAAEREEYDIPDRGELELERDKAGPFATSEAAEAGEAGLDQFKAPRDPAP
jgi:hypothetical protein